MRRVALALAAVAVAAPPAFAAFPQTPPNDPQYAPAEADCSAASVNDEQHYLYSGPSKCTPGAAPPEGATGMSVDSAWRDFTTGRPDVVIAYVEGGINWHLAQTKDIADHVFLNAGELPKPTTPTDDGRLNARDYGDTPDSNANGYVDAEDVLVRFSDGKDGDHNGYVDDISGWDFYDDQNDPATYDTTYPHSGNQMRKAAAIADNGFMGTGVCPNCTILPIKAGAEALDRTDDLAQSWLYAGDVGASVIVSVTADLGYSTFMSEAVGSLWKRGVIMVEASNDFDSTDHQGGHFHPHVIPGNGMLTNSVGIPGAVANPLTTSFTARSGKTSWGTKNFVTVSTQEGSTSQSTPIHGGTYALLVSASRALPNPLTSAEILQVVRATATDIDDASSAWPTKPGFDLQYGYGRPNVHRAMEAMRAGKIPPVGWISSPDWYALFDPTKVAKVDVRGHVEARRSSGYRWTLQAAPGAEPDDGAFFDIGSGAGAKAFDGRLGTLDLARIPREFWTKAFTLSKSKVLETNEAYTVTLRLRVTDAAGLVGEERRSIAVQHDPTWRPGFPKKIGPSGEASPQLVDLQGTGRLAAVFGDADGQVHAIDAVTARELRGWPVATDAVKVLRKHSGVHAGHEPVISNAAVGDLDGSGRLSVVVASTSGKVYVFGPDGARRRGWPRRMDTGVRPVDIPRPKLSFTRLAHMGSSSSPVLVDLDGDKELDVVAAGWDGHVHAWHDDASAVTGWPVATHVAAGPPSGQFRLDDQKLVSSPAVADLDGDRKPELVVRSQQFDIAGDDIQPFAHNWSFAFHADGKRVTGWPIKQLMTIVYYGSAQEFITEGANTPAVADVDRDGRDDVAISPIFSPTELLGHDGKNKGSYGVVPDLTLGLLTEPARLLGGGLPTDAMVSFTTSGAFGRVGTAGLTYAEPGSGAASIVSALLLTGSGLPITNAMRAYTADGGSNLPGYPSVAQGLDFLGGPTIADVTGDGAAEILEGGDSSALHAFGSGGAQAPGFPKFTTGWTVWAPTVGDVDADGKNDVFVMTREGYLMGWKTPGLSTGNREWWSFRHDERNTSRYGVDARPPSAVQGLRYSRSRVTFSAPGDDWLRGRARRYTLKLFPTRAGNAEPFDIIESDVRGPAGTSESIEVPSATKRVEIQAVDEAGNYGTPLSIPPAACVSRRVFTIHVPRGRGPVRVTVGGKRVKTRLKRGRRTATVDLRKYSGRSTVTVRIRVGQHRQTRTYRTCTKKPH